MAKRDRSKESNNAKTRRDSSICVSFAHSNSSQHVSAFPFSCRFFLFVLRRVEPNSYKKKAEELRQSELAAAMETVKELEHKLAAFAKTHKHTIQHDPECRAKFFDMCKPLGVDPLSAENGFWGSMLGIGEFYYELSVKVAEICLASRSRNGGIMR